MLDCVGTAALFASAFHRLSNTERSHLQNCTWMVCGTRGRELKASVKRKTRCEVPKMCISTQNVKSSFFLNVVSLPNKERTFKTTVQHSGVTEPVDVNPLTQIMQHTSTTAAALR